MYLPEWALPFKEKGTEIKKINNGFYKYEACTERSECITTYFSNHQIFLVLVKNFFKLIKFFFF